MWPHRRQPTRLPRPWGSPGKNTGVGCHFLLQCMKVKIESEVPQSCLTLSDAMDCSPSGSSVHGIFQARVLEWGAIAFSLMLLGNVNCKDSNVHHTWWHIYSPRTDDAKAGAAETLIHWGRNRNCHSHQKWGPAVSNEATQKLSILSPDPSSISRIHLKTYLHKPLHTNVYIRAPLKCGLHIVTFF